MVWAGGKPQPLEALREERYDLVATLTIDGKLSWDEAWGIPECELRAYLDACVRRAERIKRHRESK